MALSTQEAKAIQRNIERTGATVTVSRETITYNALQPNLETGRTSVSFTPKAWNTKFREGELSDNILVTDRKITISPNSIAIEPTAADVLTIDGDRYDIVPPVKIVQPASVALVYVLQARK